ncbi:MAG: PQQ-binding-like beta-propeller repeat protein [Verrucomicrobiota bacterium]|nr:PQQ-binding-like beta-propeller repeat protein [Verrucomicrobiota bacterium]
MIPLLARCLAALILVMGAGATETENLGITALRARGPVTVDGAIEDWDLSGGIFACGSVETARDTHAVWFHLMYDAGHLYLLARFRDETPLNNPGQTIADNGFEGDSLQVRFIARPDTPNAKASHWTCWRGRESRDVIDVAYGVNFDEGGIKDARTKGARQAFAVEPDRRGYLQELALPWALLGLKAAPAAGERLAVTLEPNFTVGGNERLSIKDLFRPGVTPNRVFTFSAPECWSYATFSRETSIPPRPVRLADNRQFPVAMAGRVPAIDWTGLIQRKELAGQKVIALDMPFDGYCSLNIFGADGSVARHLLNAAFLTKGRHELRWDGLGTPNWTQPGEPVRPGTYTWSALVHPGIGLRLRGWAANAGSAPWDGPTGQENWGGDHGVPVACAAAGESVYLGWSGAEAGKALVACGLDGAVKWRNSRQSMAGAEQVAVDGNLVYAVTGGPNNTKYLYRLAASDGSYVPWPGSDSPDLFVRDLWRKPAGKPDTIDGLAASGGRVYLAVTAADAVLVVDGATGKLIEQLAVPAPSALAIHGGALYAVSARTRVLSVELRGGARRSLAQDLPEAHGLAVDAGGSIYVAARGEAQQVFVFSPGGKRLRAIGRPGGRRGLGSWRPEGMLQPKGLALDANGTLWVAEEDAYPKRISAWDGVTGAFIAEFFGPSSYGAPGGAIDPEDPNLMVGQGCAWRLDPATGRARCVATITRTGMENARFATGRNGRVYLVVAAHWAFNSGPLRIFERRSDSDFPLRGMVSYLDGKGKFLTTPSAHGEPMGAAQTVVWADRDGDAQLDSDEIVSRADGELGFSGWYMSVTPDLALHNGASRFPVTGWTACGAPIWNLAKPVVMPAAGLPSADGRLVLQPGEYGVAHSWFSCFDLATGKLRWRYPDTFVGVHGSHTAPPPEPALIRGSFGPCGTGQLSEPIGSVWAITSNVGEWHLLTGRGFYLTRLFQGDSMKVVWPEKAVPGAVLDNCPPGLGGEDFGGSMVVGKDGKLYLQAGKTAFWNVEVVGLEQVRELRGGTIEINKAGVAKARLPEQTESPAVDGPAKLVVPHRTPSFTGDIERDFGKDRLVAWQKQKESRARGAIAYDEEHLYVAWEVQDATPWVNGAGAPEALYLGGDTVDLQLGTDPAADPKRTEAVLGDLRLSIGPFGGKPAAVLYRKVAALKKPKVFTSGVVKEYVMEYAGPLPGARIMVTPRKSAYVVEAKIPLSELGLKTAAGLRIRGDLGVTFGDPGGRRTRLRSYWANQNTGIVDDAVFELAMEPNRWGELEFAR